MLYVEHAAKVYERNAVMIPETEISSSTGFRSVYKFDEYAAAEIVKSGVSRDFKRFSLYSDELFIDIDILSEGNLKKVVSKCKQEDICCKVYHSGCKGYHISIPTVLKTAASKDLTYTQNRVVHVFADTFYDKSIYRSSSLIRLPGTIHEKTGNKKQLIEVVEGNFYLDYDIEINNASLFDKVEASQYDSLKDALDSVVSSIGTCQVGSRYHTMFFTGLKLLKAGLSFQTVEELISILNASWGQDKKTMEEVQKAIKDSIKAIGKGY